MNMKQIADFRNRILDKQQALENSIKQLELEKKRLWIGWYGLPGEGVDVPDYIDFPSGARVTCTDISADGNFICAGYEWRIFNAYFPNPLSELNL